MKKTVFALGLVALIGSPALGLAQTARQQGASDGGAVGGRVGEAVGGIVGSAVGLVTGDDRPRFRRYVEERHVSPYRYDGDVIVGSTLPSDGVEYYEAPPEYKVSQYRYTVVNGRTVLVEPGTRRIVQIID